MARPRKRVILSTTLEPAHKEALETAAAGMNTTTSEYAARVIERHLIRTGRVEAPRRAADTGAAVAS